MAKSKNHTAHNQGHKNHRNGIKKPKRHRNPSMKGVDPKFLRNLKYVRKGNIKAVREKRKAAAKALQSEKMET